MRACVRNQSRNLLSFSNQQTNLTNELGLSTGMQTKIKIPGIRAVDVNLSMAYLEYHPL
jgi:hypothetical protein